jgi:hypothetical protein
MLTRQISEDRWRPEAIAHFRRHRQMWLDGLIRLENFAKGYKSTKKGIFPKWFETPLGERVLPDKAKIFEQIDYKPSAPACEFHSALARVKVFSGGAGAGKSLSAAMDSLPVVMTPGTTTWLVAPQYSIAQYEFDYIHEALLKPCWEGLFAEMMHPDNGGRYVNQASNGKMLIKLWWPEWEKYSVVEVRTAKSEDSLLGVSLDYCVLCEGSKLKRETIENKLLMRMFRGGGVLSVPSSPSGMGWLAEWYQKGLAGEKFFFATNSDTRMNPLYATEEKLEELREWSDEMDEADFNEQVGGKPQARHGNVYPGFDPYIHCDAWEPDWPKKSWPVCRVIDFGWTDPFVCLWVAFDEDWRAYVFGEIYQTQLHLDDAARAIAEFEGVKVSEPTPERPYLKLIGKGVKVNVTLPTVVDWDAGDRMELQRMGVAPQRLANKDIDTGIKAVNRALRIAGDGKPRIYINRKQCPNTVKEITSYEWSEDDNKPKPKQADHGLDCIRYAVRTLSRQAAFPKIAAVGVGA